jgi:protein gp37
MGRDSRIEWTSHTFNAWRGCTQVSPGCAFCYAEATAKRNPGVLGIWGDDGTRVIAAEAYWAQPRAWNAEAKAAGERRRVFCLSMGDVFEDRPELLLPRHRLFDLIRQTPALDWLLLTKRPENIEQLRTDADFGADPDWWGDRPPANVWLGVSVEDQKRADERIRILLGIRARVHFLSIEPLVGPMWLPEDFLLPDFAEDDPRYTARWVIVGGESGPHARPMHPDWARSLRDQCQDAGLPFFFKQWGEWAPGDQSEEQRRAILSIEGHGGHRANAVRFIGCDREPMFRVGKKAAGRLLDGRTWDELPVIPMAVRMKGAPT